MDLINPRVLEQPKFSIFFFLCPQEYQQYESVLTELNAKLVNDWFGVSLRDFAMKTLLTFPWLGLRQNSYHIISLLLALKF